MSNFLRNLAKTAQKLYYGNTKAPLVADRVNNFADYLGDTQHRSEEQFKNDALASKQAAVNKKQSSKAKEKVEDEPEVLEAEVVEDEPVEQVPKKASVAFMVISY